jgi:signal transduction histidine kinase
LPAAAMMLLNVRDLTGKAEYAKLAEILSDVLVPTGADLSHVRDFSLDTPEPTDLRITTIRLGGRGTRPTGWLVVCQDVTELKSLLRMRESGIRFLSHEMRSPLTTFKLISSVFQELADRLSDNRSAKLIEIVDNETDRMLRLVGKFLDVAALDEGSYQPGKEACDVARLVTRVGDAIEVRGAEKGVLVSTRCAEGLPTIQADPDGIEDVLYNLCDNALKYTDEGGSVSIEVAREDEVVTIAVSDTGCGIPEDAQELIFEEFAQVQDARAGTPLEKGVGLGLYTVRRIVEIHGGRVEVDSEVGRGSTFRVYLPIAREEG